MAPAVAASCMSPDNTDVVWVDPDHPGKWIGSATVLANSSAFMTIDGTAYQNKHFFAIINQSRFNTSLLFPYTWVNGSYYGTYSDRMYMETLNIGTEIFPCTMNTTDDYEWNFIDRLDIEAYKYKKGLAGYGDTSKTTYYLWYGNETNAETYYSGHDDWLVPTFENATYLVNLTVEWR